MKSLKLFQTIVILLISTASFSQIIFTNISDTTIYVGDTIFLDINSDGVDDFSLLVYTSDAVQHTAKICVLNNNSVATHPESWGDWVTNFGEDELILGDFLDESVCAVLYTSPYSYGSQGSFGGAIDAFIGLKIVTDNNYYGWLQIDVSPTANWVTIKGYAYNSCPDDIISTPILTNKNEIHNCEFKIYPNPTREKIFISSAYPNVQVKVSILNIEGKVVFQEETNTNKSINISYLKEGIYFLKIESENSTIEEKFVKL